MKIHVLPITDKGCQPDRQDFIWPPHNAGQGWGIEQDFLAWLLGHPEYLADGPGEADWHYLSVFFNRYFVNNAWGESRLGELQAEIDRAVLDGPRTFYICEYDIPAVQPFLNLWGMLQFTGNMVEAGHGIHVPLLCAPHRMPDELPDKQYLACFIGNFDTCGVRSDIGGELGYWLDGVWCGPPGDHKARYHVEHGNHGTAFMADLMLRSLVALAPRGDGNQSYRFYEAMSLAIAPMLIADLDSRPFKRWIDWDSFSFWRKDAVGLDGFLRGLDPEELLDMGRKAWEVWHEDLRYGQWCRYLVKELEEKSESRERT